MGVRARLAAVAFVSTTIALASCIDPVDFPRDARDASAVDAPSDASVALVDSSIDANPVEGSSNGGSCDFRTTCLPPGDPCVVDGDCCLQTCRMGICLENGACGAPGTPCQTRDICCSHRCEPSGMSMGVCQPYCRADTAPCTEPLQCCSLSCNNGFCGGPICAKLGDPCMSDAQCCMGHCDTRHVPRVCDTFGGQGMQTCRQTGEACGGVDGGSECCSHVCNAMTGRCDLGGGGCRENSTPCQMDSDCCTLISAQLQSKCLPNNQGVPVCVENCVANGQSCGTSNDCCSHKCRGTPSVCVSALTPSCGDH